MKLGVEMEIMDKIQKFEKPKGSTKFRGAATIEVIKYFLEKEGFNVSERDSFIKGIPNEIDLIILKKGVKSQLNFYYLPEDVLAVFEIKYWGSYGESTLNSLRKMISNVSNSAPWIKTIYLTVGERKGKNRITENILENTKVFELFVVKGDMESSWRKGILNSESNGAWDKLIKYLNSIN